MNHIKSHIRSLYNLALLLTDDKNRIEGLFESLIGHVQSNPDFFRNNFSARIELAKILAQNFIQLPVEAYDSDFPYTDDEPEEFFLYKKFEEVHSYQSPDHSALFQMVNEKTIKEAVMKLPYRLRLCYLLRDIESYSYQEISTITGLTETKAADAVCLARKLMQKSLWGLIYANRDYMPDAAVL